MRVDTRANRATKCLEAPRMAENVPLSWNVWIQNAKENLGSTVCVPTAGLTRSAKPVETGGVRRVPKRQNSVAITKTVIHSVASAGQLRRAQASTVKALGVSVEGAAIQVILSVYYVILWLKIFPRKKKLSFFFLRT
jgi:hypothetical protein